MSESGPEPMRPLVITRDEVMLEELLRVAAAAQVEVTHTPEPASRSGWRTAPLVLLDAALAPLSVTMGLPRRPRVVAVVAADAQSVPWDACIRLGVERTLRLGESDDELIALLADAALAGPGDGHVVAVVGGCGGAGASVLATAIAAAADRRGRRVLLADCDRWGAGLDVLLGVENAGGVHWGTLAAPSGRLPADALHGALPPLPIGHGGIVVLCHGRDPADGTSPPPATPELVEVLLRSGRRSGELIVVDLPRELGTVGERVVEAADLVVLIVTADIRGCFGGARVAARLSELGVLPGLVVRGPSPGGIVAQDIADTLGLELLAAMRPQPGLARDLEEGRVPGSDRSGPLARVAQLVLDRLDGPEPGSPA